MDAEELATQPWPNRAHPKIAAALDRLQAWEPEIDAWAHVAAADGTPGPASAPGGPLEAVPFGVKDVIDVAGQPTRFGSALFDAAPASSVDAPLVAALREAGAVPIGKTRTTEFAFTDPTTTRNPYDRRRTPGGSSSGSGAVVGAGIVPFALGTQTAGSLCRPATYCGAASYKPGLGVLPTDGMAPLSPTFDAIGVIAADAAWLRAVFDVLARRFAIPDGRAAALHSLSVGLVSVPEQQPDPSMSSAMDAAAARLRADGHKVERVPTPVPFPDLIDRHRVVMESEAAAALLPRLQGRLEDVGPKFRAGLTRGATATADRVEAALAWVADARRRFWERMAPFDLLLAYPVSGAAPLGLATTGDQSYLTPWTTLGGPLVSLPAGTDPDGMPLGLLLAMPPGQDARLVHLAGTLESLLPPVPQPRPTSGPR